MGAASTREKNCLDCSEKDVQFQTPWENGVPKPPSFQLGHVSQASMEDSHTSLDSLIARIYKAKYFPSSDILNAKISSTHPMLGIASIVALRCSAKAQDGE